MQHLEGLISELRGSLPARSDDTALSNLSFTHPISSTDGAQVFDFVPYDIDTETGCSTTVATSLPPSHSSTAKGNSPTKSCYLPPKNQGSSLLNEFLHDFNSKIPLFSPESIYTHVRDCYSGEADGTPLTWVLTYLVFGIAHRLRAMSLFALADDTSKSDWYLKQSLAVLPELLLQEPSVPLVQALLGVSILLQTSVRVKRASIFICTAMYMAQDLGLNDASQVPSGDHPNDRVARYLFWIAYFMHTDECLSEVRPLTQRLADISTPLPESHAGDWWTSGEGTQGQSEQWNSNVFALHAQLAVIQAESLEELFSVKARERSATSQAASYNNVITKLAGWRSKSVFTSLSPRDIYTSMYRSDLVHTIILEATYFRTLYQLHAASALGGFTRRIDVFGPMALRSMAAIGTHALHQDARRFLTLIALMPSENTSTTW